MIITKSWLNEYVNLEDISTEQLAATLNSIGLEVDRVEEYKIPKGIVYGYVVECEKHPDADKLNVCKVDIGTTVLQIVCGASNVRKGLHVAVATVATVMPNGQEIVPVKLRGIQSEGMICSATELSLVAVNDGIMELDESVQIKKLGDELSSSSFLQDTLIEIELTANRGDCLSVHGVARDLCVAYGKEMVKTTSNQRHENLIGIGRILQLSHVDDADATLKYKVIELQELKIPFLVSLRLAQIGEQKQKPLESLLAYATHMTGVILRAYDFNLFKLDAEDKKAKISVKYDENNYLSIYSQDKASTIGVAQEESSYMEKENGLVIIEASYIPPEIISQQMALHKKENAPSFYLASRGSEPDLVLGFHYFLDFIEQNSTSNIYGGSLDLTPERDEKVISITMEEINSLIGKKIEKSVVTKILQNLSFNIKKSQGDTFVVIVPKFRHDIANKQDIIEEILRFVGIDNIEAKPFEFKESNCLSSGYFAFKKLRYYRHKAAYAGFFETVHFVFNEKKMLQKYAFDTVDTALELVNPIVATLDTLRPTLLLSLLQSASENAKSNYKDIKLFEIGSVFTSARQEVTKMAFLYSGDIEKDSVLNSGKPNKMDFGHFVQMVSNVIGSVELVGVTLKHGLAHPYQCANVVVNSQIIGSIFKLHPEVQNEFDLDETFVCELDFEALSLDLIKAKTSSKYQTSFRDLSLLVPDSLNYQKIQKVILENKTEEIVRFYPVDKYQDEKLGSSTSLTIRFVLQSLTKTLEEEDITSTIDGVLNALNEKLGIALR